jgi:protein-S-isoprenylcysteine O-methyltransferase Ste14
MTIKTAAAKESEALDRYQKMRRLWLFVGIVLVGGFLFAGGSAWANHEVPQQIELAGIGFIWIGVIGRLWSILYIGGHKASTVIMDGPYSVMRNPLYFFSTIAAVGVGFQSGTLTAGLVFGGLCYLAFQIVARREEKHLLGVFGAPYAAYMSSVPRFFPNPRLFKDQAAVTVSTRRMYSTLLDGLVFFVALPAFELAEYLQETGVIPVLFRLY